MAKDYNKGEDYQFYLDTANTWATPTYVLINAIDDLTVDPGPSDVEVPARGISTGHLQGKHDPTISFTLLDDVGDANVETLVAAIMSGASTHIMVSDGIITETGTHRIWHMEAVLTSGGLEVGQGDPASYSVEAKRHANSDFELTRDTIVTP